MATPSSDISTYFDAPIANFHSAPTAINDCDNNMSSIASPRLTNGSPPMPVPHMDEDQPITTHPNGSAGWLPATDLPDDETTQQNTSMNGGRANGTGTGKRASNFIQRSRSVASRSMAESIGKKSVFTNSDGRAVAGSTFINGAGTTGPNAAAEADESLRVRSMSAEESLTKKQKEKIKRSESKSTKHLSKIIKYEGKIEQKALSVALQELGDLQKMQKAAVKRESIAHARHTKAQTAFMKAEEAFLLARTKFETAQAAMNSEADVLDLARQNARQATEGLAEKSQEVDGLRTMLGVDERERAVKLTELNPKSKGFFSR